jgi:hypothetical protein
MGPFHLAASKSFLQAMQVAKTDPAAPSVQELNLFLASGHEN